MIRTRRAWLCLVMVGLTTGPAVGDEPLRWRVAPGESLLWIVTTERRVTTTTERTGYDTTNHSETGLRFDVHAVAADSTAQGQWRFTHLRTRSETPEATVAFDSRETPAASNKAAQNLARRYAPLFEVVFTASLTPRGEFTAVLIPERTIAVVSSLPGLDQLVGLLRPETFNDGFQQLSGGCWLVFPERPLAVGDGWQRVLELNSKTGGQQSQTFDYQFNGWETAGAPRLAHFTTTAILAFPPESNAARIEEQSHTGQVDFDAQAGRIVRAEQKQQLFLQLNVGEKKLRQQIVSTTQARMELAPRPAAGPVAP